MLHLRSRLKVADNTGAKELAIFSVTGKNKRRHARLGDVVNASVKSSTPQGQIKKGEVVQALIVRTRKEVKRKDGTYIRFDENAAVILNNGTQEPKGTRIFGPIPRELRDLGYMKIISLAPEVL